MIEVKYKNGVVLKYDETIQVGSIITAYHAGYHRVTKVTQRPDSTPHYEYVQLFRENGEAAPKRKNSCDASYCIHMTNAKIHELFAERLASLESVRDQLLMNLI